MNAQVWKIALTLNLVPRLQSLTKTVWVPLVCLMARFIRKTDETSGRTFVLIRKVFFSWSANPSVYKYGQTNGLSVQTNYLRSSSAKTNLADSSSGRTETNINTCRVVCIVAGLTKCQQERQQSLGWRGRPAPGVFVPECDTNGEYKSTQCHESSGLCWCVDAGGNEVPRTRIRGRAICRPSGKLSN